MTQSLSLPCELTSLRNKLAPSEGFSPAVSMQYTSSTTLERQAGSSKHASFVAAAIAIHAAILGLFRGIAASTGPLPLIFANLTLYLLETPSMQHFTLLGVRLTDKAGDPLHAKADVDHIKASPALL